MISCIDQLGGGDFSTEINTVTLWSDTEREVHRICIGINHDTISEEDEGFILVLSTDERQVSINEKGVALAIILDDDGEFLRFPMCE